MKATLGWAGRVEGLPLAEEGDGSEVIVREVAARADGITRVLDRPGVMEGE